MSYDIDMVSVDGDPIAFTDLNYTYNVSPMLVEAFGTGGISCLAGVTGEDARPRILEALNDMRTRPKVYKAMNPPNGWGDAAGLAGVLAQLAEYCAEHPRALVRVG